MYTEKPTTRPEVEWVGFVLTWTAGFIDAIGFLTLRQIYVANMSGNTVAVAIHLARRDWTQAWSHACPVAAFVPGLIVDDAIVEFCKRLKLRSALMPALAVEASSSYQKNYATGSGDIILRRHHDLRQPGWFNGRPSDMAPRVNCAIFSTGIHNCRPMARSLLAHRAEGGVCLVGTPRCNGRRISDKERKTLSQPALTLLSFE